MVKFLTTRERYLTAFLTLVSMLVYVWIIAFFFSDFLESLPRQQIEKEVTNQDVNIGVALIMFFVTLYLEELVFRGLLLVGLIHILRATTMTWVESTIAALLLSSILFGYVHIHVHPINTLLIQAPLGAMLGIYFLKHVFKEINSLSLGTLAEALYKTWLIHVAYDIIVIVWF